MLQDELQKVFAVEGATTRFAGLAFRIPECNPAVLIGDDIFFADLYGLFPGGHEPPLRPASILPP